jgi:uncharacterized protein YndB with AHSA1/START domain
VQADPLKAYSTAPSESHCMASRISNSITIERPIEDVFAVLTEVENTGKWFPGDVEEWWTSEPPLGVGSTRRARVRMGWFTSENDAVATVYEPPRWAVMKGTSPNTPFEATITFEPVPGGTRVDAKIQLWLAGPRSCSVACSPGGTGRAGSAALPT